VRERVEADGVPGTAETLGLADATVARVLAGLDVQRGTIAVLERALERDFWRAS
jgi:hypothetical protein